MHNFGKRFKENIKNYWITYYVIGVAVYTIINSKIKNTRQEDLWLMLILTFALLGMMTLWYCQEKVKVEKKHKQLTNEIDSHFDTFEEFDSVLSQVSRMLDERDSEIEELNRKLVVSPKFKYLKDKKFINCKWKV